MAGIAPDVIGGFNTFLDEQRAAGPDARITLVQFYTGDVHVVDGHVALPERRSVPGAYHPPPSARNRATVLLRR